MRRSAAQKTWNLKNQAQSVEEPPITIVMVMMKMLEIIQLVVND